MKRRHSEEGPEEEHDREAEEPELSPTQEETSDMSFGHGLLDLGFTHGSSQPWTESLPWESISQGEKVFRDQVFTEHFQPLEVAFKGLERAAWSYKTYKSLCDGYKYV